MKKKKEKYQSFIDFKMKVIENEDFDDCLKMEAKNDRFISFMNSLSFKQKSADCNLPSLRFPLSVRFLLPLKKRAYIFHSILTFKNNL